MQNSSVISTGIAVPAHKKKILFFIGTRPELIKIFPLIKEFSARENFQTEVAYTGQHDSIMKDLFNDLSIMPCYRGSVLSTGQTLNTLHSKLFEWVDEILVLSTPDIVVVHGDTATATIASLASKYRKIMIAHIEAGLRTHDQNNPFPEEINRQIIGRVADFHFAPTIIAKNNLIKEGIFEASIFVVGNTVVDAVRLIAAQGNSENKNSDRRKIIVTMHRRENHGTNINEVSLALQMLFAVFENIDVYWIEHPNKDSKPSKFPSNTNNNRFNYIPQIPYTKFIHHIADTSCIITDSGGLQEEAAILDIDTLIIREVTERPETINNDSIKLTSPLADDIFDNLSRLLNSSNKRIKDKSFPKFSALGDGYSSKKIYDILLLHFSSAN